MSIQSAMFLALGFLAATLLALLFAPVLRARAVRLTTRRLKEELPLTAAEIQADKDRIRAENAITVHKLESDIEQVRREASRQRIEINRRDATVNELEKALAALRAEHEEALNARRVLEHTVADRLPRVEQRLSDTRRIVNERDKEIAELAQTAARQREALAEAAGLNAQQQAEIERLVTSLAIKVPQSSGAAPDAQHEVELALRSELEALRTKAREQASLLDRMQAVAARAADAPDVAEATESASVSGRPTALDRSKLSRDGQSGPAEIGHNALEQERELRKLRIENADLSVEIARLTAAVAVFESERTSDGKLPIKESRLGLKARVQSLEAQSTEQTATIGRLRSELAAANERLTIQSAEFTRELKRLGAGTLSAGSTGQRRTEPARLSLADRVAQTRNSAPQEASATGPAQESSSTAEATPEPKAPASETDTGNAGAAKRARLLDRLASSARSV